MKKHFLQRMGLGVLAAVAFLAIGLWWINRHVETTTPATVDSDVLKKDQEPVPISPQVSVPVNSQPGKNLQPIPNSQSNTPASSVTAAQTGSEIVTDVSRGMPVSYVKNELLLKFNRNAADADIQVLLQRYGLTPVKTGDGLTKIGYRKVRLPDGSDAKTVWAILIKDKSARSILARAEPNYIAKAMLDTSSSDPLLPRQWYLQAESEFKPADMKPGQTITVAVLDTGVDATHPDLAGQCLPGYDAMDGTECNTDGNGHGTHVAGIIAAKWNDIGIRGLCPYAKILQVKVLDDFGNGTYENVVEGIIYAADQGAKVINLSFGGYAGSDILQSAIAYASEKKCILVASAGNDGVEQPMYPAACRGVIAVRASDRDGKLWVKSNTGRHISSTAPGVDILSTENGGYEEHAGTSASSAIISALSSNILINQPDLQASQLLAALGQLSSSSDNTSDITSNTPHFPLSATGVTIQYSAFVPTRPGTNIPLAPGAPVHQWIVFQAFRKLANSQDITDSAIKNEMKDYLPTSANDLCYQGDENGTLNAFIPESWDKNSSDFAFAGESTALIEGAYEEDTDEHFGGWLLSYHDWSSHYWNPDGGFFAGMNDSVVSALQEAAGTEIADEPGLRTFSFAIDWYKYGETAKAYYWLGRTAHLLADMSVPAHTLLDDHVSLKNRGDSFECYTARNNNFRQTTAESPHVMVPITESMMDFHLPANFSVPDGTNMDLVRLFYGLAKFSKQFDSDDKSGNKINPAVPASTLARSEHSFPARISYDGDKVVDTVTYGSLFEPEVILVRSVHYDVDSKADGGDSNYVYLRDNIYDIVNYNNIREDPTYYLKIYYTDGSSSDTIRNLDEPDEILLYSRFYCVPSSILKEIHQPWLEARAIGYVAALYKLFWRETHCTINGHVKRSDNGEGVNGVKVDIQLSGNLVREATNVTVTTKTDSYGDTGYYEYITPIAQNASVIPQSNNGESFLPVGGRSFELSNPGTYTNDYVLLTTINSDNHPPNKPTAMLPADAGTVDSLTPTLTASTYSDPDVADSHAQSLWTIWSKDTQIIAWSSWTTIGLTSIAVPAGKLDYATHYMWTVQYMDNRGAVSVPSVAAEFITPAAPPNTGNNPPNMAACISPINGASVNTLTPTLTSAAFSDPNLGDTHWKTWWDVRPADTGAYLWDSGWNTSNLTSITVPAGKLEYGKRYKWRVRHMDNHGLWSSSWDTGEFLTVKATGSCTLSVASCNSSNVAIASSLPDNNAKSGGVTPFNLVYKTGAVVTLTAPTTAGGNNFLKWQLNGVDAGTNKSLQVTMSENRSATAIYGISAPTLPNLTSYKPSGWSDSVIISTATNDFVGAETIYEDQEVYVNHSSHNASAVVAVIAQTYTDKLFLDDVLKFYGTFNCGLAAYSYRTCINWNIGKLTAGVHTIRIETDANNEVAESNEIDNTEIRTIEVHTRPPSNNYNYSVSSGTATITGYIGPRDELLIPSTIEGYTVVAIGSSAFSGCTGLTSITIPNSVTIIGSSAFKSCSGLTSVTFGKGVTSIGDSAFSGCTSLASVTIPDSVTYIGEDAFRDCTSLTSLAIGNKVSFIGFGAFFSCTSLTTVTIPASVTYVGCYAFSNCTSLTSVMVENGVTGIGNYMFKDCTNLTSITLPNSVASIGEWAFASCTSLTSITIPDGVTSIEYAVFYGCTGLINLTIPDNVTSIGDWAFGYCSSLTSIEIPNSVTSSIGYCAFYKCTSLTDITIGNGVTSIGEQAFYDCNGLTSVTIGNSVTSIGNYAFYNCTDLTGVTIPDSVTSIGVWSFGSCSSLTSLTIGKSVSSIGESAFYGCRKLTNFTIPDSVTRIEKRAFAGCSSLTNIIIPDSVTSIGDSAFGWCNGLTSITFGNGITSIGANAFTSCYYLTQVNFKGNAPTIGDDIFMNDGNVTVYYLSGTTDWGQTFGDRPAFLLPYTYTINNGTITITGYTGSGGAVDIPSIIYGLPVTSIGADAFYECKSLTSVTIRDGISSIGAEAFYGCNNMTSATIPASVISIGDSAFSHCDSLTELYFKGNATTIGEQVFLYADNATVYYLLGSTGWSETFGDRPAMLLPYIYTTNYEDKITITGYTGSGGAVVIPNIIFGVPVTSIGDGAFYNCKSLTSVTIRDGITSIGHFAFNYCRSLTNATIPDSVTSIGDAAFQSCFSLTSVTIGKSVTSIGIGAFFYCDKLTIISIPANVTNIGDSAFRYCHSLTSVKIPSSITSIGDQSFSECTNLKYAVFLGDAPIMGTQVFDLCASAFTVYYQTGASGFISPIWEGYPSAIMSYTYTLTYDAEGGSVNPTSKTVNYDAAYGVLATPTRTGYTFAGWWTGDNATETQVTEDTIVSNLKNHTIYAKWTGNSYTLSFDAEGGTVSPMSKTVTYGSPYGALPTPVRAGYAFNGWRTGDNGTGSQVSYWVLNATNHTVYAKWIKDSTVGAAFIDLPLPDDFIGNITIKGLPAGLKYNALTKMIAGVPTKAGMFSVVISAPGVATQTLMMNVGALPAWAYGSFNGYIDGGVNSGTASMTVTSLGKITGKLVVWGETYTFSAASYVTGGNPADGFSVTVNPNKQFAPLLLTVSKPTVESVPQALGVVTGKLNDSMNGSCTTNHDCLSILDLPVILYRDVWKETSEAPPEGYYTATLPGNGEYGSGYLAFTVDAAGKVKVAGKLADGTVVSLSGTLILDESGRVFAVIYASPAAYKDSCLFGLVEFVKPEDGGKVFLRLLDGVPFNWENLNIQATGDYGSGFLRAPGLSGGWYDNLVNLQTYYANGLSVGNVTGAPIITATVSTTYWGSDDNGNDRKFTDRLPTDVGATCWNPGGLVLTVTDKGLGPLNKPETPKKDPVTREYNYELGNATGLTISLMRATGIFRGSFNVYYDYISADNYTLEEPHPTWAHVIKKASYQGILTPEREDPADGIEGRGFYLWPGKDTYEKVDKYGAPVYDKEGNPILIPYSFNWSYDFILQSGE